MHVKLMDIVIITVIAVIIAFYTLLTLTTNKDNTFVKIEVEGEKFIYNLDIDQEIKITGKLGVSTINIKDKKAGFTDSPCKNKTCIHTGFINRHSSACLPNGILMTVEGENNEIDQLSY